MQPPHESFDYSPEEFRRLGHQLVELMIDGIAAQQQEPVLRQVTGQESRALLDEPLPHGGTPPEEVMAAWRERILPYCRRNGHPRFFGYVCTSADPMGILADGMASALNQVVTAWRSTPGASEVERLAVRWLDQLVGFAGQGNGLLVSGGSAANFHGLACAVTRAEARAGDAGRRDRMTVYISREGHVSMRKACRLLGIRDDHVRLLDVDERRRMSVDDLSSEVRADRDRGLHPAAVCASAGTANTGAVDPLVEIAEVCRSEGLWYHIDGAYGAPAALTPSYRWMSEAFSLADSLSLDPHKWLFAPADVGCVLVRDEGAARAAFAFESEYTTVSQTESVERYAFFDHGLEMSRRFRGLKVWSILKTRGVDKLRSAIQHDIDLRKYLDARIEEAGELEHMGSELSIVCFRYVPQEDCSEEALAEINRSIVTSLVRDGRFYLSPTELDGRFALRVCIVNFRTTETDLNALVAEVCRLGDEAARVR